MQTTEEQARDLALAYAQLALRNPDEKWNNPQVLGEALAGWPSSCNSATQRRSSSSEFPLSPLSPEQVAEGFLVSFQTGLVE